MGLEKADLLCQFQAKLKADVMKNELGGVYRCVNRQ